MKNIVILGAGTAGTILANKLHRRLAPAEWHITILDRSATHYYQPGFLFIPFGLCQPNQVIRFKAEFLPAGVTFELGEVERIDPRQSIVHMADGQARPYDFLIIATGAEIQPAETDGLKDRLRRKSIFDFYTFDGAVALSHALEHFTEGRLVLNIAEMPIKCPVAPLEFMFLADAYFTQRGLRDKVELRLVTPLSGAFTRPRAAAELGDLLTAKGIQVTPDFSLARVDNDRKEIVSWDGETVPFDLLVSIPTHKGDAAIERSGLGDELAFVPTDKHTLRSSQYANIFAVGDAANVPASKAGSVAHFESEIVAANLLSAIAGQPLAAQYDGHTNCFIETGYGKGLLIDFNYETEPVTGTFPLAGVGPFSLLKESRVNHFGKLAFRYMYWNLLLPGYALPFFGAEMSRAGKQLAQPAAG